MPGCAYCFIAVRGSAHTFTYSLSPVVKGVCVLRFNNEAGMGVHYHMDSVELPYSFSMMPVLLNEFGKWWMKEGNHEYSHRRGSREEATARFLRALETGKPQGAYRSLESTADLWSKLSPKLDFKDILN